MPKACFQHGRPKASKLALDPARRDDVQDQLSGLIATPDGIAFDGPRGMEGTASRAPAKPTLVIGPEPGARSRSRSAVSGGFSRGSNHAHPPRSHLPGAVHSRARGALRRELSACLSSGRALRLPREPARSRGKAFIADALMISDRPAEIGDRAVPGHWEGDLILGLGSSAIGTLVERTTRFTMLLHLPRLEGHGTGKSVKNGPALAGHGAEAVRDAIAATISSLPAHLRRSLTCE